MYYFGCDQFYFPPAAALPGGSVEAEIFSSNFKMWLLWHILWGSLGILSIWGNIGMPCNNDFFSDKRCLDETLGHLHQQAAGQIKNQMGDHSEHCTVMSSREFLPLQSEKVGFPHPLQQPQPRHQGPARLHRRAHRAQARGTAEAAANAAVPKKLEPAVEADKTVHTTDTALQAFVQACPTQPSHDAPAEQERHQPSPIGQPQEHVLQHQVSPLPLTNMLVLIK